MILHQVPALFADESEAPTADSVAFFCHDERIIAIRYNQNAVRSVAISLLMPIFKLFAILIVFIIPDFIIYGDKGFILRQFDGGLGKEYPGQDIDGGRCRHVFRYNGGRQNTRDEDRQAELQQSFPHWKPLFFEQMG